jgi:hypothetical protein
MSWEKNWKEFLIESKKRKKKTSRKSGAGLEKSLKWFLDTGPQKKGGYPKNRRPNFRRKKFNNISAPPGAPGGLEESEQEEEVNDGEQMEFYEIENEMLAAPGEYLLHVPTKQVVMCGAHKQTEGLIRVLHNGKLIEDKVHNFKKIRVAPKEKIVRRCSGCKG